MSLVDGDSRVMRGVVRILMQSPIYLRMPLAERKILVRKLCAQMGVSYYCPMISPDHNSASTAAAIEDSPTQAAFLTLDLD